MYTDRFNFGTGELRMIASGELEEPAKSFFNERHAGRWRVLQRIANLFVRQLENVTGETFAGQDWGANLCGRIGASALERRLQREEKYGKNSSQYDSLLASDDFKVNHASRSIRDRGDP